MELTKFIPIAFDPIYRLSLPVNHRFPMEKYELLPQQLLLLLPLILVLLLLLVCLYFYYWQQLATLASTCEEKAMDRTAATRAYSEIVSQWKLIEKRVSTTKRLSPAPPNLTKVEPKSTNADDTEVEL